MIRAMVLVVGVALGGCGGESSAPEAKDVIETTTLSLQQCFFSGDPQGRDGHCSNHEWKVPLTCCTRVGCRTIEKAIASC